MSILLLEQIIYLRKWLGKLKPETKLNLDTFIQILT